MRKPFFLLFVFLLITPLFFITTPVNAYDDEWLIGWDYRKSHAINNATGSGTNYQIKIVTYYGSGSDSGNEVYLNSHSQTDFDDIRFADDDGITLLDLWLQEKVDSDYAIFWFEVADDLSSSNQLIYMYYGNSSVSSTSNGRATWIDFEDNEDGGEYIWTVGGGNQATSTSLSNDVPPFGGLKSRQLGGSSGGYYAGWITTELNSMDASNRIGYWLRKHYSSSRTETLMNFGEPNVDRANLNNLPVIMCDGAGAGFDSTGIDNFAFTDGIFTSTDTSTTVLDWYFIEILVESTTLASYYFYDSDRNLLESEIDASLDGFSTTEESVYVYTGSRYVVDNYYFEAWFDTLYVGKYVNPEPSHGIWGEEENVLPMFITFHNQTNSVFMTNGTIMSNGTIMDYVNETVLSLQGIINVSTQFIEWNTTTGNIYINPYNYTVLQNATIWLIVSGVSGGDGETLFLFGSVNAIPMNLLYYIALTTIGLTLLLKTQYLGKILSVLLFAFQAIWISGDVLLDTQINYISAYNETTGIYLYANTVTHIGTPILSFLVILSIGLALKGAIDVFRVREKRKG